MIVCPACNGLKGGGIVHVRGERDGQTFGEWRDAGACRFCGGLGEVPDIKAARYVEGRRRAESRKMRHLSLREEAARLDITPKELNDIEWGRYDGELPETDPD